MADTMQFELVSPERKLASSAASSIQIPGINGDLTAMPNHAPFLTTLRESGATALVMTGDRTEGQLFPGLYGSPQPPGRGTLVRRGRRHLLIRTALVAETDPVENPA